MNAFEEYARWMSPIGMSPRRIAEPHTYAGFEFQPEDRVFFMFSSANRDEDHFENSDQYDVTRDVGPAISFGAGPHFCAGAWISKAMIAEVALPLFFDRFPNARLLSDVHYMGWAFSRAKTVSCCCWLRENAVINVQELFDIFRPDQARSKRSED